MPRRSVKRELVFKLMRSIGADPNTKWYMYDEFMKLSIKTLTEV